MQTPNNLGELQRAGIAKLKDAKIETAALDARLLLCHAADVSHEKLVADKQEPAREDVAASFNALIDRRAKGEPVARLLGTREFWGMDFLLGPDTLVPRPDSECIVEAILEAVKDKDAPLRVLDLGTGSGCLLLALLKECQNATGLGIDISQGALSVAATNAKQLGFENRTTFSQGIWAAGLNEQFDIVVSNPPYIPSAEVKELSVEVRDHDPGRALDGGEDGMDCYKDILEQLPDCLCQGGIAAFETSPDLYTELQELVENHGQFHAFETIKDITFRNRGIRFLKGDFPQKIK